MVDIKRSIKDYGLNILRELLNGKPQEKGVKASLDDLSLDDLRREKIRLDQEERKLLTRLQDVEKQKRNYFEEGVRSASVREQGVAARKIKELDVEANNMDRILNAISKQKRIINGLLQVKDRERVNQESSLSGLLKNMDLQDLIMYIDRSSVDGEFNDDKLNELIHTLEGNDAVLPGIKEEKDVQDIISKMQQAREAIDNPDALNRQFDELSQQMRQAQQEGSTEAPEPEL
jgi:hypothetical protein